MPGLVLAIFVSKNCALHHIDEYQYDFSPNKIKTQTSTQKQKTEKESTGIHEHSELLNSKKKKLTTLILKVKINGLLSKGI